MAHLVLVELVHKPCLGLENLFDVVIDVRLILQRRHASDHREAVDVVGAGDPADAIHHCSRSHGNAEAQPSDASCFGEGAQHHQVGRCAEISLGQNAVSGEGLIELIHHHQRAGCGGRQLADRLSP